MTKCPKCRSDGPLVLTYYTTGTGAICDATCCKCSHIFSVPTQDEIATLRATIEAKDAEIADLKHDTDELIRVRREVIKRADAAEARVKELENELQKAIAPSDVGGGPLAVAHDRIAALERELAEAYAECRMLRTHICEIDKALGAKPGCGGSAIEDITRLTAENAALMNLLSRMRIEIDATEADNAALREDRNTLLVFINSGGTQEDIRAAIDAAKGE